MRRQALLLLLIAACSIPGARGFYEEGSAVIDLDDKTFESEVLASDDSVWIIEFYAPWCGHCKALAPTYEKVAKNLDGLVKVGAVDCDKHPSIAEKFGVRGFPTLKTFTPEKTYNPYTKKTAKVGGEVSGGRSAKALVDQALAALPNYVMNVSMASSATFLSGGDYPKAVLLSDKPAPPSLIKSLAVQFKGRIRFGMGSSEDAELAKLLGGVSEFPKLVVVPGEDASKAVAHTGKLKGAELSQFLSEHARKDKLDDPLAGEGAASTVKALSSQDFEALLKDKAALATVYFHQGGAVPAAVSQLAKAFKMFQAASFDCAQHAAVCKEQVVGTPPVLRLYMAEDKTEYEEFTGKSDCLEDCFDLDSMSDFVADSIPNIVVPITEPTWNSFLAPAYERPRVLLFSKKDEPTSLYKSVALNYKDILPFGIFPNPPKKLLEQIGLKKIPQLLIFFSPNATAESVQGMPYQGDFTFEGMTAVIDQFAAPFRDGFDPNNPSGKSSGKAASPPPTGPVPEISNKGDESTYEKLCGGRGGLCAIAFLDGSEANKDKREEQLKMLEELRTKLHPSPFHMAWVDAVCHSDFAISFEVSQDRVPTVAVISPSKGRYVQHIGKFQAPEMEATLQGVLSGKKQTGPFSSANPLSERDCAEVHAEILAATQGGGSEEEDEIMREMMEEIKRKEAEAESEDDSGSKKKKKKKKKAKK